MSDSQNYSFSKWFGNILNSRPIYGWTSLWVLFVVFFGLFMIYNFTGKLDVNYSIVVVWAIGYFFLGALFGCILGVPKGVSKPQIKKSAAIPDTSIGTDQNESLVSVLPTTAAAEISYNSNNTNLTDISDWLTKIVIGAGLVHLKEIPGFIMKVARRMSEGIHLSGVASTEILCAGIIVYYLSFGLIAGYFIMRSILLHFLE